MSPREARYGAARGSAIQGLGKGGALSPVLIVQATAEEVHLAYYKPRHKLELELIQPHKAQMPVLRSEVNVRALPARISQIAGG